MMEFYLLDLFDWTDFAAVALLLVGWQAVSWRIEHPSASHPSITRIMSGYRHRWMKEMITREPRIFDAQVMSSLRQGTAFFASTALISIGGVLALASNPAPLEGFAETFGTEVPTPVVWQIKLLLVILCLTNGFLKFVWSNRLFGYCAVLMGAVPNDPNDPEAQVFATKAAQINVRSAINFNRGLRSMYFALAALAWLIGAIPLAIASAFTLWVLWNREFSSLPRRILLSKQDATKS
ncbi:MAG: DUF599 domain-containing protein [Pseudomonadota bacterium]